MGWGLRIELACLGTALFAAGVFVATRPSEAGTQRPDAVDHFTPNDYAIFDRDFSLRGEDCALGLKSARLCFGNSPYEDKLSVGQILPVSVPAISAEFAIIVATDTKLAHLKTVRFGHTLALFNPETRQIVDLLNLDAASYELARQTPLAPAS